MTGIDWRKPAAEFIGTAFLLAAIVGSGIMAERLSAGNAAIALLANSVATGAALFALIQTFAPISGAHFNPAVTIVMAAARAIDRAQALPYVLSQVAGAIVGVWVAHLMFDMSILQASTHARTGIGQWTAEFIATFGLVTVIECGRRRSTHALPASVALYITAAYWFTSSTSFANPAVTLARSLTDTFAGITPADVMAFIAAQATGAGAALLTVRALNRGRNAPDRGLASAALRQRELAQSSDV